jgi:hypothetical protein
MHRIINEIDLFGLCKKTVLFFIVCYPDQNAGVPHRVRITMNWFLSQANGAEKPADNVNNEIWSTAQKEYLSDWQNALKDDNSFHKLTVFSYGLLFKACQSMLHSLATLIMKTQNLQKSFAQMMLHCVSLSVLL